MAAFIAQVRVRPGGGEDQCPPCVAHNATIIPALRRASGLSGAKKYAAYVGYTVAVAAPSKRRVGAATNALEVEEEASEGLPRVGMLSGNIAEDSSGEKEESKQSLYHN